MNSYSLPGTTYNLEEPSDLRYQAGARFANDNWNTGDVEYSSGVRYLDGNRYLDDGSYEGVGRRRSDGRYLNENPYQDDLQHQDKNRYVNHHWQPRQQFHHAPHEQVQKVPHQHVRPTPRSVHKAKYRKELAVPVSDECSCSDGDDESESGMKKATRKKKAALLKKMTDDKRITALAEELAETKRAAEKKVEAEEMEREEKRLKEREELEEFHRAETENALAAQLAAFVKAQLDKETAARAEAESQAQAKLAEQELIRKAEADGREAERKDAADMIVAQQAKIDAGKRKEEKLLALVKQDIEKWLAEQAQREAEKHHAAEIEREKKQKAEDMKVFVIDTKKTIYDLEKTIASNKAASMKALKEKSTRNKKASHKKTAADDELEARIARMKDKLAKVCEEYDLGSEIALLEGESVSEGDDQTDSMSTKASSSLSARKDTAGQSKQAHTSREGKGDGKSTKKVAGDKNHRGSREGRNKEKKSTTEKGKLGLSTIEWLAGESYLSW